VSGDFEIGWWRSCGWSFIDSFIHDGGDIFTRNVKKEGKRRSLPGRCGKVDLYRLFNVSNYPASGSVRILISPWGGGFILHA
jgi:hypothetical protein